MNKLLLNQKLDLIAAFKQTANLNWHEGVANHFSICNPENKNIFYVNKNGIHFSNIGYDDLIEITPENLENIKKNPNLVDPTAINIHSEIHKTLPKANCILHVHSKYASILSCLKNFDLPPIHQNTMRFYNRIAHVEYGGMGFEEEAKKIANSL